MLLGCFPAGFICWASIFASILSVTGTFEETGDLLLLPGSRSQPVSRILPSFLDAFEILLKEGRELNGILPVSDSSIRRLVENLLASRTKL